MSLQKLIEKMKDNISESKYVDASVVSDKDLLSLCQAAEVMREELKNISHGENRPGQHRQWAQHAFRKADEICKE